MDDEKGNAAFALILAVAAIIAVAMYYGGHR